MEDGDSFDSWRPAWQRYGTLVSAVASRLSDEESGDELRAHIVSSVATAFVDSTSYDPLEALLTPFLDRCSSVERSDVAGFLISQGVPPERAQAVSKAKPGPVKAPVAPDEITKTPPIVPAFEDIQQVARATEREDRLSRLRERFEARMAERAARNTTSFGGPRGSGPRRRHRGAIVGIGAVVIAALGLTVTGVALGAHGRSDNAGNAPYLVLGDLSETWDIVAAATLPRLPARNGAWTEQTFAGPKPNSRVIVRTQSFAPTFTDAALGTVRVPLSAIMHRPQRDARAFVRNWEPIVIGTPPDPNQALDLSWTENGLYVTIEARSLTAAEVEEFAHALVPVAEDPLRGWRSPDARYKQSHLFTNPGEPIGARSAVALRSRLDPNLNVVATVAHTGESGDDGDSTTAGNDTAAPITRMTLGSGRRVAFDRSANTYEWIERGNHFIVSYAVGVDNGRAVETDYTQGMPLLIARPDTSTDIKPARIQEIERLADAVRAGSRQQWSTQLSDYQARLLAVPVANHLTAGTYTVNLRVSTDPSVPQTVCTHLLCSPVYRYNDRRSADLDIEGHWWHFEEIPASQLIPSWRTSPDSQTDSHPYYRQYGWYGVDLGERAQAARRNNESILLARPSYG